MPPVSRGPQDRVPRPGTGDNVPHLGDALDLTVQLPAGGTLTLLAPDEVTMWNETSKRYQKDYKLQKTNDLVQLGAILSQVLAMYRAQKDLSDVKKAASAQAMITSAADQIRKGEKALGLDKATREKGGSQTVADYVTRLKKAAFEKGVRISARVKEFEAFNKELEWKLRILENGDTEDKAHHGLTEKSVCQFARIELAKIAERDKEWAKQKASLWVGTL